ncbi:MAG: hypothetical protein AAGP08_13745, partial [Pseudomonadota bacterium]
DGQIARGGDGIPTRTFGPYGPGLTRRRRLFSLAACVPHNREPHTLARCSALDERLWRAHGRRSDH